MKKAIMILILLLVVICGFAQAPDWQWATQAGGSDGEVGDSGDTIAIDDNGNSYITGIFEDTANFGSYSLTSSGQSDIFVAKMDANGNWLWATKSGGSNYDFGFGITIDDNGNSYVTGHFSDTAGFGSYSLTSSGNADIFLAKLDTNGNWLWATNAGGGDNDAGNAVAIDDNGNSYVTGNFWDTATFGSYSLTSNGIKDIFVAKLNSDGNWLWATKAGGSGADDGDAIAIDDNGNSYVTGCFADIATFGSYSLTSNGDKDIFIAKMNSDGNWLWATKAGGDDNDAGNAVAIDDNGNSYVTGYFEDTTNFGSNSLTSNGQSDIFVAKMNSDGNWLWATKAGGNSYDEGYAIAIDDNGNSYVTGYFEDTANFASDSLTSSGQCDIFVAKMNSDGNWLWSTRAGGGDNDEGNAVAIDDNGNCYVTGYFEDTANFSSYFLTSSGQSDIFVAKLGNDTSVEIESIRAKIELSNYPNPFNPSTTISFSIKQNSKIELEIFNLKGQLTKSLINGQKNAGEHSVIWDGRDANFNPVSSGIYIYKLKVDGIVVASKRCLLLK